MAVAAVLRAGATERSWDFAARESTLLVDGGHCIQRVHTRYLVKLPFQALSEHVGADRAFSHHRSRPQVQPSGFFWTDNNASAGKRWHCLATGPPATGRHQRLDKITLHCNLSTCDFPSGFGAPASGNLYLRVINLLDTRLKKHHRPPPSFFRAPCYS